MREGAGMARVAELPNTLLKEPLLKLAAAELGEEQATAPILSMRRQLRGCPEKAAGVVPCGADGVNGGEWVHGGNLKRISCAGKAIAFGRRCNINLLLARAYGVDFTAIPMTSKCAPKSRGPEPRNARAGNGPLKNVR